MKRKFVDELHWIDMTEMLDLTALAQSSPGAIAVNACNFSGMESGRIDGNADSGPGDHTSANVDLICNFVMLSGICIKSLCQLDLKGNAGGVAA